MSVNAHDHAESPTGGTHLVSVRLLAGVLIALIVMTWVTVAATGFDLGNLNLWLAMAIAVVKGSLVALYFMHLRWDRPMNAIFFIGALFFVMLFVALALMDTQEYQPEVIPGYAPAVQG